MSKKMITQVKKDLENTKVTGSFAITTENGIIRGIGNSSIMQPNIKFSGKPMPWFDDSKLLKKQQD